MYRRAFSMLITILVAYPLSEERAAEAGSFYSWIFFFTMLFPAY